MAKVFKMAILNNYFTAIYPGGYIERSSMSKNRYLVTYDKNGKIYKYYARSLYDLASKLKIVSQAFIDEMQGCKRLPCGCPVSINYSHYKCSNCQSPWREPTDAELEQEKQAIELWS